MTPSADRVPVLMYHRVEAQADAADPHYCISAKRFAKHMQALARAGMSACSLPTFLAWQAGTGRLPAGSVLITFDDGFAGVAKYAAPVLHDLDWPATIFVITGHAIKGDRWTSEAGRRRPHELLGARELSLLAARGFSIQSHSRSHPDLTTLSDADLDEELAGSRDDMVALAGAKASSLAYPFGRHDDRVTAAAHRAGYQAAFTTASGFNRPGIDPLCVRRLDMRGTDSSSTARRKVELGSNDGSLSSFLVYQVRRLAARI